MNEPTDGQIDEIVRRVISGPCPAEGHGGRLVLAGWRAAEAENETLRASLDILELALVDIANRRPSDDMDGCPDIAMSALADAASVFPSQGAWRFAFGVNSVRAGDAAMAAAAPPSAPALDRLIPEQVRCPICQTFLDDANEAHDCVVAARAVEDAMTTDNLRALLATRESIEGVAMTATAKDIGVPLLLALGVDPKNVRSFTLRVDAGKLPIITIEQWIASDPEFAALVGPVFRGYELRPKGLGDD